MSRNRWIKRVLAGALTVSAAGGCKQQLFMEPGDYHDAVKVQLPKGLETDPHAPIAPGVPDNKEPPPTVIDFVRPARNMTLRECIALALEQGNIGSQSPNNFGFKNDGLVQFGGRAGAGAVGGTDAIRAFAVEPAKASAEIERSLSRFDARWVTTMQWQKVDQPVAAQFLSFQQTRDAATLSSSLVKPLPTGGLVGITTSIDYSKFGQQATQQTQLVNPNYTPRVQVAIEQPLLRLFGVEINQIVDGGSVPSSQVFFAGVAPSGGVRSEGILITRIGLDQAKADFESKVNFMLVNVEAAYWNLYAAYYNLYAQEEGLRQAFEGYRYTLFRVLNGTDRPQVLDQIQAQFHRFQRQVYQARGQVLESERQLRGLLGLWSPDGTRIVPIDEPNLAPYKPDFREAAVDAIALRPELLLARQDVKFNQLNVLRNRHLRRPDLRGFASYDVAGLGTRLGGAAENATAAGSAPGNAFGSIADNRFNSWTLGVRLDIPLGFRDANATVRQAQLDLIRSYIQLRDTELKAIEYLALQDRRVIQSHQEIVTSRAEREALQQYVARIKIQERIDGKSGDFLSNLTVQQQLAAAIAAEARAVADYNIALASFEYAKGTIQQYNNVSIGEGPLPPWVSKRAADHIRERTEAALKLREQPAPAAGAPIGGHPIAPAGGTNSVLNLPPFAEKRDPVPEMLPPRPVIDPKGAPGAAPPPGGAVRPVPGNLTGLTGGPSDPRPAPRAGDGDDIFQPNGRVTIPAQPSPPGARPGADRAAPAPLPLPTGPSAGDDIFKPTGRATIPPLPPGTPTAAAPAPLAPPAGAAPGAPAPGEIFQPNGRVTIPPPPRPSGPIWDPPVPPGPPPVAPAPTPLPPTLPPIPGGP